MTEIVPTHRAVVAFMSAIHQDPDLALETFVLKPDGNGDPVGAKTVEGELAK